MKIRILIALVVAVSALAGCSPSQEAAMIAAKQSLHLAVGGQRGATDVKLNPKYHYIRVTRDGRVGFFAQGSEDKHPQGPVEVWFSGLREVLRLQNGRLVGVAGVTVEWRNVMLPALPSWSVIARDGRPVQWVRVRDVMPGYRFGVRDELSLRPIAAPQKSELQKLDPKSLQWFEEQIQSAPRGNLSAGLGAEKPLSPARYAVDLRDGKEIVVYGEQCLSPEFCFTWQRWQ